MGFPHCRSIASYVHQQRVGVLLELAVESDFTLKLPEFQKLAHDLAIHIAGFNPADVEALLQQPFSLDQTRTVRAVVEAFSQQRRETLMIRRFVRWDAGARDPPPPPAPTLPRTPAVIMRFPGR